MLGVPLAQLCNENFNGVRTRILMKNICYAGVLAALLELDLEHIRELLAETYAKKPQLVDSNMKAIELGYDYARQNFPCPLPLRVEKMDTTAGHIMIDGNTAAALGCMFAGATVAAWYPITPSTSLMDAFKAFCDRMRVDPETGAQELRLHPGRGRAGRHRHGDRRQWNGARAFTADLRSRHLADERVPRPRVLRRGAGGDLRHPARRARPPACRRARSNATSWRAPTPRTATRATSACIPANPEECFYMAVQAFDLAERLQTPVLVLSDLDIGMNDWMCRDLKWDDSYRPDRGKVLGKEEIAEAREVLSLPRQGRRRHPATARCPGVHPEGRVLHARLGPHAVRRLHRGLGRVPDRARPADAEVGHGEEAGAARHHRRDRAAATSASSRSAAAMARCARRMDVLQGAGRRASTTCACAPSRSARTWSDSSPRTSCCSSSSRTATRSCARCSRWRPRCEKSKLRSLLHYSGLPISSSFIVEGVLAEVRPQRSRKPHWRSAGSMSGCRT